MAVKISGMMGTGSMGHNNRKFITENVDPARTEQNITLRRENLKQVYHELLMKPLRSTMPRKQRREIRYRTTIGTLKEQAGAAFP